MVTTGCIHFHVTYNRFVSISHRAYHGRCSPDYIIFHCQICQNIIRIGAELLHTTLFKCQFLKNDNVSTYLRENFHSIFISLLMYDPISGASSIDMLSYARPRKLTELVISKLDCSCIKCVTEVDVILDVLPFFLLILIFLYNGLIALSMFSSCSQVSRAYLSVDTAALSCLLKCTLTVILS